MRLAVLLGLVLLSRRQGAAQLQPAQPVVRWRTTLLTALAFTLVVALLTVMLAFVNGMYQLTEGSGQPGNVMVLSDGATDELFSNLGFRDISEIEYQPGVLRDGEPPAGQPGDVPGRQPADPQRASRTARKRRFLQVRGIDDPAIVGPRARAGAARRAARGSRRRASRTAARATDDATDRHPGVLGEGIARELGDRAERCGSESRDQLRSATLFQLGERDVDRRRLLESAGSTFDSEIWAKRQIVGAVFGKETYTTLVLRTGRRRARGQGARTTSTTNYKKPAVQALRRDGVLRQAERRPTSSSCSRSSSWRWSWRSAACSA